MISMRARTGDDKRWFNPDRDILYLLIEVLHKSLKDFDNTELEEIKWLNDYSGLCESGRVFAKFFEVAQDENVPADEVLERCGFNALPLKVRLAVGHRFLITLMRSYAIYMRDMAAKGEEPKKDYACILKELEAMEQKKQRAIVPADSVEEDQ